MNKWKKRFLTGFPVEPPLSRFVDLAEGHPDLALCHHIASAAADARETDIETLIHRLVAQALGKRAFERAQRDRRGGLPLAQETAFICSRAARMICYERNSTQVPTHKDLADRMFDFLRTPTEREEAISQPKALMQSDE